MPKFTIETTYRLPIFRQRCYEAETLEAACRLAIEDEDWSDQKEDYETSGETYVTGVWAGDVPPYSVPAIAVPAHFDETVQRKADMFGSLLELLQEPARPMGLSLHDFQRWQPRAQAAVFKARAIIEERHGSVRCRRGDDAITGWIWRVTLAYQQAHPIKPDASDAMPGSGA